MRCNCGEMMYKEYGDWLCPQCDCLDLEETSMNKTLDDKDRMGGNQNAISDSEIKEDR